MGLTKSKPRISSQDRAILDLKGQRDRLHQYQKKLQTVLERETKVAREQLALGNKKRALLALKKKRYQEQLIDKTAAQMLNLEELVFEGLKAGNEVLAALHKETSLEAVQKLMDDTADAIEYQREVDEIISGKISEEDEAAVLAELDQIEKESAAEALANFPEVPEGGLPERPIAAETSAEEEGQAEQDEVAVEAAGGAGRRPRKMQKENDRIRVPAVVT
ncbi:MAG: Snf7-domain-containing protein [Olpidium bornovanus]|uniref:Snf7-domain-containing protein n=1 Tax=Olpidium bornovanus TaxID=278681 RepID=A0A8H8DGR1_9FUNG|nr:MAG: Snf7-domain-containing protein [Olpidium bornovanus]